MSLISHNMFLGFKSRRTKREVVEEPTFMQANGKDGDGKVIRADKRKKPRKDVDEKDAVEQEKKMKKLESFLFGNIYAPVEFGKEEDEDKIKRRKILMKH